MKLPASASVAACIRTTTDKVVCWGDNAQGHLSDGRASTPTAMPIAPIE